MISTLIKKDYKISKIYVWFSIIACLITGFLFAFIPIPTTIMIVYINFILTILFNFTLNQRDTKNKSDTLLNSFRITRKTIVTSRYLTLSLFSLLVSCLLTLPNFILLALGLVKTIHFSFIGILIGLIIVIMAISAYLPFLYKFGPEKMRMINILIYVAFILLPTLGDSLPIVTILTKLAQLLSNPISYIILALLALVLVFFSYKLSVKFYSDLEL